MQSILRREFSHLNVNFPFFPAPMVGLTHVAFRDLIQSFTPPELITLWPTEMLNSRRIPSQNMGETPESLLSEDERRGDFLLNPQILGNEEQFIKDSIVKLKDWGACAIDLNMGCPVKKALKHNYGVSLIGDPDYAAKVVGFAKNNTDLPISVKTRAGENKEIDELMRFVSPLINAGVDWLTLHPRTPKEKRKGTADWLLVEKLRSRVDIPIVGNGDIQNYKQAIKHYNNFLVDGVMIGRGLTSRPWMLWQIAYEIGPEKLGLQSLTPPKLALSDKPPMDSRSEAKYFGLALKYFVAFCFFYFEERDALKKIKFMLRNSSYWLNFGQRCVSILGKYKNENDIQFALNEFFQSDDLSLSETTNLRY